MSTNHDDLNTYDMTGIAAELDDLGRIAMTDEEYAVWVAEEARREFEAHVAAQADEEADVVEEILRMARDLDALSDDDLADVAAEARIMCPNSLWSHMATAACEERLAG